MPLKYSKKKKLRSKRKYSKKRNNHSKKKYNKNRKISSNKRKRNRKSNNYKNKIGGAAQNPRNYWLNTINWGKIIVNTSGGIFQTNPANVIYYSVEKKFNQLTPIITAVKNNVLYKYLLQRTNGIEYPNPRPNGIPGYTDLNLVLEHQSNKSSFTSSSKSLIKYAQDKYAQGKNYGYNNVNVGVAITINFTRYLGNLPPFYDIKLNLDKEKETILLINIITDFLNDEHEVEFKLIGPFSFNIKIYPNLTDWITPPPK